MNPDGKFEMDDLMIDSFYFRSIKYVLHLTFLANKTKRKPSQMGSSPAVRVSVNVIV